MQKQKPDHKFLGNFSPLRGATDLLSNLAKSLAGPRRGAGDSVHVHVTSDCSLLGVVASSRHSDRRRTRPLSRRLGAMHGRPLAHSDGARARDEATTVGWSAAPRW